MSSVAWPHLSIEVLPLLAVISPVIGLVTSIAVVRWQPMLVRPMVLSNAAMTTLLVIAMIAVYKPDDIAQTGRSPRQMQTAIGWLQERDAAARGINVQLSFGADGLCIWPALLLTITVWSVIGLAGRLPEESQFAFSSLILVVESLLLASLFASDVIAGLALNEAALVPVYLLVGSRGNANRRQAASHLFMWQFVGCSCSLMGVTLLAVSRPWMQSDLVPHRGPLSFDASLLMENLQYLLGRSETALHIWSDVAPCAGLFLMLGFAIRLPVFPFHHWYELILNSVPTGTAALVAAIFPIIALNGWLRLGGPLFFEAGTIVTGLLAVFSIMGLWRAGLLAHRKTDLRQMLTILSTGLLSLSCAACACQHQDGIRGAWLLTLSQAMAVALGILMLDIVSRRSQTCDVSHMCAELRRHPRLATVLIVALLGWAGMPFVSGIASLFLVFFAAADFSVLMVLGEMIAVALLAGAVVRAIHRVTSEASATGTDGAMTTPSASQTQAEDLTLSELLLIAPQLILVLALNLFPSFVLDSCQPSLKRLFRDAPQSHNASAESLHRAPPSNVRTQPVQRIAADRPF